MLPVVALCSPGPNGSGAKAPFFQGQPETMRLVSTFSLDGAWRVARVLALVDGRALTFAEARPQIEKDMTDAIGEEKRSRKGFYENLAHFSF